MVASLLAIALLLVAGAVVSPAIVPWPRLALGLETHRGDLTVMGLGVAGIAFALLCVRLVAP